MCLAATFCFLFLQKIREVKKSILFLCLMMQVAAFSQEWTYDLETAKKKAALENKNILLVFSGSDWCAPCMQMEKNVWHTEEFITESKKTWVLLRADFLQKKGDPDPVDINDPKMILTEKYNRDGFFPFFVLLDKFGKVLGKSGYEDLATAEEYITYFKGIRKS
jgi:thioredoxin-related protein